MKKFITAMIVLLFVGVTLCVVGGALIGSSIGAYGERFTEEIWTSEERFDKIQLEFNSARHVTFKDGDEYSIAYSDSNATELTFSVNHGVLTVEESAVNKLWIWSWFRNRKITDFVITIPASERIELECDANSSLTVDLAERENGYGKLQISSRGGVATTICANNVVCDSFSLVSIGATNVKWQDSVADSVYIGPNGALTAELSGDIGELDVNTSGALNLNASNLTCQKIKIVSSGASRIDLSGSGETMTLKTSGACTMNAGDFSLNTFDVDASGSGSITVAVSSRLTVKCSSVFKVRYYGDPVLDVTNGAKMEKLNR